MPTKGEYRRERLRMTAGTVTAAARLVESGRVPGRGIEYADTATPGLTLRVTARSMTWYLRHRRATIRIGTTDVLDLAAARRAAEAARSDLAKGLDPRPDIEVFDVLVRDGIGLPDAADRAFPESEPLPPMPAVPTDAQRRRRGPWQWRDLIHEFLASKTPTLKEGYRRAYEAYHRGPEFEPIEKRLISKLRIADLEDLRYTVVETRTRSAAARVVSQNREALDWAFRYYRARSGLADVTPWWRDWDIEYRSSIRDHTPLIEELGRTLAFAERHRSLGSTGRETEDGMLAALWALVLTGQRTGALGMTRRAGIILMPDRPDWQVWTWNGREMKGGRNASRPHALPIPPEALQAIARCGASTDGPWLFPSRVKGRHVTPAGYTQMFYRFEGKTKVGKGGRLIARPEGNLFERYGVRVWTPHDVRRTLATFLDEQGLGGAGSAILAHSRGKGSEEERIEDVTRRVYAFAQRLELKARGMSVWVPQVLAAYERERTRL